MVEVSIEVVVVVGVVVGIGVVVGDVVEGGGSGVDHWGRGGDSDLRGSNLTGLGGLESLGKVSLGLGDVLSIGEVGVLDGAGGQGGVLAALGHLEGSLELGLGGSDLGGVLEGEGGGGGHKSGKDLLCGSEE